jgi:hypothetical protein
MRVAGRDHQFMLGVLQLGQLLGDAGGVVVVDEGDGSHNSSVRGSSMYSHQLVADEVAKGFGAVGVTTLLNQAIKPIQKVRIQRNSDSAQNAHTYSRKEFRITCEFSE